MRGGGVCLEEEEEVPFSESPSSSWRDGGLRDRLAFALEQDALYKDVLFVVGPSEVRVPAHKLILRLSSTVFEGIINAYEEQGLKDISLPHTDPHMFQRLLRFIYTDELDMADLSSFLITATEFGFPNLGGQTLKVLKKVRLNLDNAVFLLDAGKSLKDREIERNSLNFIVDNASEVLRSSNFKYLSQLGLRHVLSEDRLTADELLVFEATIRWAEFNCDKADLPPTPENIQRVLGDARLCVRFTLLKYEDVVSVVKSSGILLSQEFIQILKYFADHTQNILGLNTKPRAVLPKPNTKATFRGAGLYEEIIIPMKKSKPSPPTGGPPCLPPTEDRTKEFRMFSTSIDFRELLDSVQSRPNISKLILHDVTLLHGEYYRGHWVHLPSLETFYFFLSKQEGASFPLPDRSFMSGLTLKEFLFFEKDALVPWDLGTLWGHGVDVLLHTYGLRLLEINHEKKELTLSFPTPEDGGPLIGSLFEVTDLSSFAITASSLPHLEPWWGSLGIIDIFTPTSNRLTSLVLQGVEFRDSITAVRFINLFPNLKHLSLYIRNSISMNFEYDLQQRASLEKMTLSKIDLWTYKKKKGVVPFVKCEELYLDVCSWPAVMTEHFSLLFPNLRKIAVRSTGNSRVSAKLFTDLLEIRGLRTIALCKYPGEEDPFFANPLLNIFHPPSGVNKTAVIRFLTKVGVPLFKETKEVPDFIIEKDEKTLPGWRQIADENNLLKDQMHFEMSMLNKFFDDSSVTKLVQ